MDRTTKVKQERLAVLWLFVTVLLVQLWSSGNTIVWVQDLLGENATSMKLGNPLLGIERQQTKILRKSTTRPEPRLNLESTKKYPLLLASYQREVFLPYFHHALNNAMAFLRNLAEIFSVIAEDISWFIDTPSAFAISRIWRCMDSGNLRLNAPILFPPITVWD